MLIVKRKMSAFKKNFSSVFIKHPKLDEMKLVMTILVKNEEDIIEENILFHKSMGVDSFIVTDNNSTDKTKDILLKYREKGWIEEIIEEKGEDISQQVWVDRMIELAIDRYKADWIINADADEFWYSKSEDLKKTIATSNSNVIKCNIFNMLPAQEGKFYSSNLMVKKYIEDIDSYNLSKFNIFTKQIPKVIHRAKGYIQIFTGNHYVKMRFQREEISDDIEIFHFSIRSLNHFKNKMINGGKAYERNKKLNKNIGEHWRYYYEGWKSGVLDLNEEYEKSVAFEYHELFLEQGILVHNNELKNYLTKLRIGENCE
ncbi:glycosyltransferase family 2 protein [Paenibacillus sp. HW567]|uniref:glycosyltransferase family 2 protein n=1 Tax=Paenibacillus sp. HW567 TaxID=1034769 RepID=UPI00035C0C9D|nr:glycosyltransferase family 2 protein [Paenibacillus sp. HW567]